MSTYFINLISGFYKKIFLYTKAMCFLLLLFASLIVRAQTTSTSLPTFNQSDIIQLYEKCNLVKEDTVSRICLDAMQKLHIRKSPEPFYSFCKQYKDYCLQKNNKLLYRRMHIIELQGMLRFDSAKADVANEAFENLYQAYLNENDKPAALECLYELGQYLHRIKENLQSIKVMFYAEKFAIKNNLQQKISYQGVVHKIGYILWQFDKPMQSIEYFKKSIDLGKAIKKDSMVAYNGIGMNYQKLDSLQLSMQYFKAASAVAKTDTNDVFYTVVMGSAATTWEKLEQLDTAYFYCNEYKNLSLNYPLWENAVDAFSRLIDIELQRKNSTHAKILLDSLKNIMGNISALDYTSLKKMKNAAFNYYEKVNDYKQALITYKEYVHYDSLFQDYANKSQISELDLNAAVRIYEEEMIEKEKAKKWRTIISYSLILLLVAIVFFVIWYSSNKIKKVEKDKEDIKNINQEQASEIEKLKQQLLGQLATIREFNNKFQALNTQENNKEVESIKEEKIQVTDKDIETTPADNKQLLTAFNLTQKEQWKDFKKSFMTMYPSFEENITNKIGSISSAELRLMMLHKLGLTNKEIAETLLISTDGVKKARYRLYKKIGISSTEELSEFLQ